MTTKTKRKQAKKLAKAKRAKHTFPKQAKVLRTKKGVTKKARALAKTAHQVATAEAKTNAEVTKLIRAQKASNKASIRVACDNYRPQAEQCKRCNRRIKNPEARVVGYGKTCYKKRMLANPEMHSFHDELREKLDFFAHNQEGGADKDESTVDSQVAQDQADNAAQEQRAEDFNADHAHTSMTAEGAPDHSVSP